jgi:hypothetical protein
MRKTNGLCAIGGDPIGIRELIHLLRITILDRYFTRSPGEGEDLHHSSSTSFNKLENNLS